MAQLGSALDWGSRGRGFKSRYPDYQTFEYGVEPYAARVWALLSIPAMPQNFTILRETWH